MHGFMTEWPFFYLRNVLAAIITIGTTILSFNWANISEGTQKR